MPPNFPAATVAQHALIPVTAAGRRVDQALADLFPEYSRSRLTTWLKAGEITLDGRVPRPRDAVRGGEAVELRAALEPATRSQPEPIALDILHQDEHLLVVNKPPGLVVHPGAGNPDGTLVNALIAHCGASLSGRAEGFKRNVFTDKCFFKHPADRAVVVDNPYGFHDAES